MSGGYFDYSQYKINEIIDGVERLLNKREGSEEREESYYSIMMNEFSEETIKEFERGICILQLAETYAHRIDWLVSGDDSEQCFHERLREGIEKLGISMNVIKNI